MILVRALLTTLLFSFAGEPCEDREAVPGSRVPPEISEVYAAIRGAQWTDVYTRILVSALDDKVGDGGKTLYEIIHHSVDFREIKRFCPAYDHLAAGDYTVGDARRKLVWAKIFEAIGAPESEYRVESYSWDSNPSLGLLQISYSDGPQHGCEFKSHFGSGKRSAVRAAIGKVRRWRAAGSDPDRVPEGFSGSIFDPETNLKCGMKILADQISGRVPLRCKGHLICSGSAWAVLRPSRKGHRAFLRKWADIRGKTPHHEDQLKFCR